MKKKQESRRTCSPKWSDRAALAKSQREERGTTHQEDVNTKVSAASSLEKNTERGEDNGQAGKG